MSNNPRVLIESSSIKETDDSRRALINDSPIEPFTTISQSPDRLLSPIQEPRSNGKVRLPPINSNSSSPLLLPLKQGLEKKAGLAEIVVSPVRPSELFEVRNLFALAAFANWEKLRSHVLAHRVTGKLNLLLEEKQRDILKGESAKEHEVIVYQSLWTRLKAWYIDPENILLVVWRFLFELATILFVFVLSYRLAFKSDFNEESASNTAIHVIDVFFVVAIILNFFIALKKTDGTLITDKEVIVKTYLKGYFLLDVVTIIPYELFAVEIAFIRLLRVVHLATFVRHVNEFTDLIVPYFVEGLAIIKISDFIGSLTTVFLLFILIFHLFACAWVSLGFPLTLTEKTWFDNVVGYFDKDLGTVAGGDFKMYVCSLFHVAQTFATIGYGNYYGYSTREYLFSLALLFLGILLFVFSFEKVKSILGSFNEEAKREGEEVEELESWVNMIERNIIYHKDIVNDDLIRKIAAILQYRTEADWQELFIGNEQFTKLDYQSSENVMAFALQKFKDKFHILFGTLSDSLIHLTMIQSDSRLFLPEEIIIKKGSHCKGIFLILRGSVLLAGDSTNDYFTRLESGSFFGEISLTKDRKSPMHVVAESEVNCLFIKKEAFEELAGKFPKDLEKLKALAYFRYKHFLYQKHQYQLAQANRLLTPKQVSADLDFQENQRNVDRSEEGVPLTWEGKTLPKKIFKEDHKEESPDKRTGLLEEDITDREANKINCESLKQLNRFIKKASAQAKKLQKLLSLDEEDIELVQNSTDSDEQQDEEEEVVDSETEEEEDEGGDDDESTADNDELNSSDIYPLEMKNHSDDELQQDKDLDYLEEKIMFIQNKLARLKQKFHTELQQTIKKQRYCFKRLLKTDTLKPFLTLKTTKAAPVSLLE